VIEAGESFRALPEDRRALYFELIFRELREDTRRTVEALMQHKHFEFTMPMLRDSFEKGREEGREEGLRLAIRRVLEARDLPLAGALAERLAGCGGIARALRLADGRSRA
jgi:hypothetical protein